MTIDFVPLVTEKTIALANAFNKYTFSVSSHANKVEARKQLEKLFDVKVAAVNVSNRLGHEVTFGTRRRRVRGRKPDRKIMVFALKSGDKIPGFNV